MEFPQKTIQNFVQFKNTESGMNQNSLEADLIQFRVSDNSFRIIKVDFELLPYRVVKMLNV